MSRRSGWVGFGAIMTTSLYRKASSKLLDLILSEANQRLGAQNAFAQAADQRASLLSGANAALCAAAVGVFAQSLVSAKDLPVLVSAIVAAIGFGVATWLAMRSAKCADFHPPGFYPLDFTDDLKTGKSFHEIRSEIAAIYDARIDFNGRKLVWRGKQTDRSTQAMLVTPVLTIAAAFITMDAGNEFALSQQFLSLMRLALG